MTNGVNGLSGSNSPLPEKRQSVEQTNEQTNISIFLYKDKDSDEHVNGADFDNNQALINIVKHNGWLNQTWELVGESLNRLLQHVNPEKIQSETDVLNEMVDNADLNNYSEITAILTAIGNEATGRGIIGYDSEKQEEYYQRLFKGNFESFDTIRDGGSREIKLKDGTIIYQDFSMNTPRNERGWFTVTKPDGTVEHYNDEGKPVDK